MHYPITSCFFDKKNVIVPALFCLFLLLLNYPFIFDFPTGIHFIRQTDSLSFSLYYLQRNSFNFFDVGNLNLDFSQGKAACEFPGFYYLYAFLFKLFGVHFAMIRWISLLLFLISVYCVLQSLQQVFKNYFFPLSIVLLVISSSVLRYYSLNFLPDSLAFSFTMIGISRFFLFYENKNEKTLHFMFLFITVASLLKIYYGIYLFFGLATYLLSDLKVRTRTLLFFIICLISVFCWYSYSVYYNYVNGSSYYLTKSTPIWAMNASEIKLTFNAAIDYWYTKYYLPTAFHVFIILTGFLLVPKMINNKVRLFLVLALSLSVGYTLLFFKQLGDHDYYFMPVIPTFLLVTVYVVKSIQAYFNNKYINLILILALSTIAVMAYNYTSLNMTRRFTNSVDDYSVVSYQLRDADKFLDSLKIKSDATFVVIGDKTVNGSLILLNRFGWLYPDFNTNEDKATAALGKADYLLVLQPSRHPLPLHLKRELGDLRKISFRSSHLYALRH